MSKTPYLTILREDKKNTWIRPLIRVHNKMSKGSFVSHPSKLKTNKNNKHIEELKMLEHCQKNWGDKLELRGNTWLTRHRWNQWGAGQVFKKDRKWSEKNTQRKRNFKSKQERKNSKKQNKSCVATAETFPRNLCGNFLRFHRSDQVLNKVKVNLFTPQKTPWSGCTTLWKYWNLWGGACSTILTWLVVPTPPHPQNHVLPEESDHRMMTKANLFIKNNNNVFIYHQNWVTSGTKLHFL